MESIFIFGPGPFLRLTGPVPRPGSRLRGLASLLGAWGAERKGAGGGGGGKNKLSTLLWLFPAGTQTRWLWGIGSPVLQAVSAQQSFIPAGAHVQHLCPYKLSCAYTLLKQKQESCKMLASRTFCTKAASCKTWACCVR